MVMIKHSSWLLFGTVMPISQASEWKMQFEQQSIDGSDWNFQLLNSGDSAIRFQMDNHQKLETAQKDFDKEQMIQAGISSAMDMSHIGPFLQHLINESPISLNDPGQGQPIELVFYEPMDYGIPETEITFTLDVQSMDEEQIRSLYLAQRKELKMMEKTIQENLENEQMIEENEMMKQQMQLMSKLLDLEEPSDRSMIINDEWQGFQNLKIQSLMNEKRVMSMNSEMMINVQSKQLMDQQECQSRLNIEMDEQNTRQMYETDFMKQQMSHLQSEMIQNSEDQSRAIIQAEQRNEAMQYKMDSMVLENKSLRNDMAVAKQQRIQLQNELNVFKYPEFTQTQRKIAGLMSAKGKKSKMMNDPSVAAAMANIERTTKEQSMERQSTMAEVLSKINSAPYKAAEDYTQRLMKSNNLIGIGETVEITVKLLDKVVRKAGYSKGPLFFDGRDPSMKGLSDDMHKLTQLMMSSENDSEFAVCLDSEVQSMDEKQELLIGMQIAIDKGYSHPWLESIQMKLSLAHGFKQPSNMNAIHLVSVYEDNNNNKDYCVKYIVNGGDFQNVQLLVAKMKEQFGNQLKRAQNRPLLTRPMFDVSRFDESGKKYFDPTTNQPINTFSVGFKGLKMDYTPPSGWTRFQLPVLKKFSDGNDQWLLNFLGDQAWWRAFYGFKQGKKNARDTGVLCSVKAETAEINSVTLDLKNGGTKKVDYIVMCAVKPSTDGVTKDLHGKWLVKNKEDVRPYGILIRGQH